MSLAICPTAEGVFTKLVKDHDLEVCFTIDSAGTHAYHVGKEPDLRSQAAALERGLIYPVCVADKSLQQLILLSSDA
ncbi:MAG: hypothetical protein Q7U18_13160 [Methylobacter sp.]|nr:hypothetical protein [Methylobacter sp.]